MLTLLWPWMLVLLPVPWIYRRAREPAPDQTPALRTAVFGQSLDTDSNVLATKHWLRLVLLIAAWLSLILAAARPTWIGDPVTLPTSGRDLMMAVDISRSMEQEDMLLGNSRVPRIEAVKNVVSEFVQRRGGDRLGLILFGSKPYLQTPLTFDRATMNQQLQEAQTGFAGPQTAIGDAIGLAVKRLKERPRDHRVLILLTDGANTAGEVPPLEAAQLAARENIKIYTIGMGADFMIVRDLLFNRRINPSADLDEKTLQAIADQTGGRYFRAHDPQELSAIYRQLDLLEPVEQEAETLRPSKSLFHWPLTLALAATLLLPLLNWRNS